LTSKIEEEEGEQESGSSSDEEHLDCESS